MGVRAANLPVKQAWKHRKILLPFATLSDVGDVPFKSEVERAAIFCLAEIDRKKGGGRIRKKTPEKISLLSKVYYPFWLAPFHGTCLLLDGLNLSTYSISWMRIPDVDAFLNDMNQGKLTSQLYATFLSNHFNYFESPTAHEEKVVKGLVSDLEFSREFINYLKDSTIADRPVIDGVLVSSSYDENQISEHIKELEDFRSEAVRELANLNEAVKSLNTKTQEFVARLQEEIKIVEQTYAGKIETANSTFATKKEQIAKEYSKRLTLLSNYSDKELEEQHKKSFKLEKTKEELNAQIKHIESEIRTATVNKDFELVERWKGKKIELRKQIPDIERSIRNLNAKIEDVESKKKNDIFNLTQENNLKINEARKDVREVEASRDAAKKIHQDEMEKMDNSTSNIISKIDKLAKIRESLIAQFEGFGIRQEGTILSQIYMPFYLLRYQTLSNSRYSFVAPSLVRTLDLNARLSAIGKKKISLLLQSRSQKIEFMLNRFLELMENNIAFSRDINEACSKVSLIGSKVWSESISLGMNELRANGWLSNEEIQYFSQALM